MNYAINIKNEFIRVIQEDCATIKQAIIDKREIDATIKFSIASLVLTIPVVVGSFQTFKAVLITNSLTGLVSGVAFAALGHDLCRISYNIAQKPEIYKFLLNFFAFLRTQQNQPTNNENSNPQSENESTFNRFKTWVSVQAADLADDIIAIVKEMACKVGAVASKYIIEKDVFKGTLFKPAWESLSNKGFDLIDYLIAEKNK